MKNILAFGFILFLAAGFASPASADEMADRLNAAVTAVEGALGDDGNSLARTETSYVSVINNGATLSSDGKHLIEVGAIILTNGSIFAFYGSGIATIATVALENNYPVSVTIEYNSAVGMEMATIVTTSK